MSPLRPRKACSTIGCGGFAIKGGRCPRCTFTEQGARDARRGSATARGYGSLWQKRRLLILNRDPICTVCHRAPATEVDHKIPKGQGGTDHPSNLRGICAPCHRRVSALYDGSLGRPVRPRPPDPADLADPLLDEGEAVEGGRVGSLPPLPDGPSGGAVACARGMEGGPSGGSPGASEDGTGLTGIPWVSGRQFTQGGSL